MFVIMVYVLLLVKLRGPKKINKYNINIYIPVYSEIAAKNDDRGQEKAKHEEVDDITFVNCIWRVPVWMTADP